MCLVAEINEKLKQLKSAQNNNIFRLWNYTAMSATIIYHTLHDFLQNLSTPTAENS